MTEQTSPLLTPGALPWRKGFAGSGVSYSPTFTAPAAGANLVLTGIDVMVQDLAAWTFGQVTYLPLGGTVTPLWGFQLNTPPPSGASEAMSAFQWRGVLPLYGEDQVNMFVAVESAGSGVFGITLSGYLSTFPAPFI